MLKSVPLKHWSDSLQLEGAPREAWIWPAVLGRLLEYKRLAAAGKHLSKAAIRVAAFLVKCADEFLVAAFQTHDSSAFVALAAPPPTAPSAAAAATMATERYSSSSRNRVLSDGGAWGHMTR